MDIMVQEVNGNLICQKHNHNEPITMIAIEESLSISERFLCAKCLQLNKTSVKVLKIDLVEQMIKEKWSHYQQQNTQQRSKDLQIIKEIQQKMKNTQTHILQDFDEIQEILQQWINEYDKKIDQTQLVNLIKGLEILNNKNQENHSDYIKKIKKPYFQKLSLKMEKMIVSTDLKQSYDLLRQLQLQDEQSEQIQQEQESQIVFQAQEQLIIQNQQDKLQKKLILMIISKKICLQKR